MPNWPDELAGIGPGDENLPSVSAGLNVVMNRARLARFLGDFANDSDLRDFLLLDVLSVASDAEISSTGEVEDWPALALRPFRLWEYVWLYKALGLHEAGQRVLDLGGPASHIVMAAALAGNTVHSVDLNPRIVQAGMQCAALLNLDNYTAQVGDMRDLSGLQPASFDRIVCCSVLEHLTGKDQKIALREMAKVLAPGGIIGLTFDYGPPAPGANIYLPPPHEPPSSPEEVSRRYVHSGLEIIDNREIEPPIPGSLFHDDTVRYTMSALFLGKPPLVRRSAPVPVVRQSSLISQLHISELPHRLNRKTLRQSNAAQQMSEDLETQRAEAKRRADSIESLTVEIHERERQTIELRDAAEGRLGLLEQSENERRLLQQAADERLSTANERLIALQEVDAALRKTLAENDELKADLVATKADLLAMKNEKLLTYLKRRKGSTGRGK